MPTAIPPPPGAETDLARLAASVRNRHRSHLRDLRIEVVEGGIVLRGCALTFYGKQIAFHEVCSLCQRTVVANRIEVQQQSAVTNGQ